MVNRAKTRQTRDTAAFTLIEIIVTMVILAIVALIAVPMMSSAADMQVRGAANRLAADLEYARNMAITHQRPFTVVFDAGSTTNGYSVQRRDDVSNQLATETHPVSRQPFVVTFADQRGLSRVRIHSADFDAESEVTFDYLGTPYKGETTGAALLSGQVELRDISGDFALYVNVEPMTGYVTITSP